jgi:hypothetical protein
MNIIGRILGTISVEKYDIISVIYYVVSTYLLINILNNINHK